MNLTVSVYLSYSVVEPCDLLLQINAADVEHQSIQSENLSATPDLPLSYVEAEEGIGKRIVCRAEDRFSFAYEANVQVTREPHDLSAAQQAPLASLPSEVVKYLMPSRYCNPDYFEELVPQQYSGLTGGALVIEISNWIYGNFDYVSGISDTDTTAIDSYKQRKGVCRDFAHVLIAMARAAAIPARMVSAYAPRVVPQDFHAVVEVYLGGRWHLIDPTQMAKVEDIVVIGVGRDAADVSFLTSFGSVELNALSVRVVSS